MIFPRPTNRFMIDVGHVCDLRCKMCYHLHEMECGKATYRPTEELKGEILKAQQNGNNYIDFTGGNVELHPGIISMIGHCHALRMKCCIITSGIMGKNLTEKLVGADVDDFLVSIHHDNMRLKDGSEFNAKERQERFLGQLMSLNSTYRFNCVIAKSSQNKLIELSKWAVQWKPRIFNFINMNPHNEWKNDVDGTKAVIADLDVLEEQLCEAIPILLDAGIGVNVRYYPMCRLPEAFRMHVCNDLHVMFDPYEWSNYCNNPKTFKNYYETGANMSKNIEWQGQPCLRCDLKFICGGINSAFFRACGDTGCIKAVKAEGVPRDDFYHYRRNNNVCLIDRYPKSGTKCIATIADDSTVGYIPIFIREMIECKPECDIKILSLCTNLSEIKKLTDRFIGYGILESCVVDYKTEAMEYKDNSEKYDRIKSHFGCDGVMPVDFVDIEVSKIIPDSKLNDMYRLCGYLNKQIEDKYLKLTAPPINPTAKDVVKIKPRPKPQFKHYEDELLIFTACDENYQWYIPIFIKSINRTMPEHFVSVRLVGKADPSMIDLCSKSCSNYSIKQEEIAKNNTVGKYWTAAYRFLIKPDTEKEYPYCLITDVDMLMFKEGKSIIDIRMNHLNKDGTACYENYISEYRGGEPRLPGVHFVTKDWWKKTEAVRKEELEKLFKNGANEYYYDEMMLGRLVKDSGLPLPPCKAKLWNNHGVHIGDWRLNMSRKSVVNQNVYQKMHIDLMLKDGEFKHVIDECSNHIEIMDKVIKRWKLLLK